MSSPSIRVRPGGRIIRPSVRRAGDRLSRVPHPDEGSRFAAREPEGAGAPLVDWIALTRLEGLGPVSLRRLLERFGSPSGVFAASEGELCDPGLQLRSGHREAILRGPDVAWALEQLDAAERIGAAVVTMDDPLYPQAMRRLHAPPPVLHVLGKGALEAPRAVGVVGTRAPTATGGEACGVLVRDWAREGIRVVSGMARGIDEIAHRGALEAGGETVAVLGCGLDQIGSGARLALARDISCHGVVVSEFAYGGAVLKGNFPRRNRLIAALSGAVVVAEAGERSGALVTARHALEQGLDVLACPGPAGWESFAGCHRLLREGATLCARADDLFAATGWSAGPRRIDFDPLLHLLSGRGATIEEIAISTGRSIPEIEHRLVVLELSGDVVRGDGARWRRRG